MEDGSDAPQTERQDSSLQRPDAALANFLIGLRSSGIRRNAILTAFEETHRRFFLPPELRSLAYAAHALPIACGEEATPPAAIARVLNVADPSGSDRVLEIGCGSGFQTALLARICRSVVSFERWQGLKERAGQTLQRQGLRNVSLSHGDGLRTALDESFDLVICNAALPALPDKALHWLKPGGRCIAAIGLPGHSVLTRFRREGSALAQDEHGPFDLTAVRTGVSRSL